MPKINFNSKNLVSVGVAIGGLLLTALKAKDESNKRETEKEEMIKEIMERLSKND